LNFVDLVCLKLLWCLVFGESDQCRGAFRWVEEADSLRA